MVNKNLIKKLRANDTNAIDVLYNLYSNRLYRFIFGYLKTEEDSLDVIQEIYLSLWDKRTQLKNDTNIEAYLFTIARNTVISIFRKKLSEKEYVEYLRNTAINNTTETEKQVDYNLLNEKVEMLVDSLPNQRKKIYKLSKEKGYTNKAIAEELNISVKTVEDHITKARKFLKENLGEYGLLATLFFELFIR